MQELLEANPSNEMFAAAQRSMDRNVDIKTYGSRLASVPVADRGLILNGSNIFTSLCVTCHGPGGKGLVAAGTPALPAPPLVGSKRIDGDKANLVKILLHGLQGPVDDKEYPSVMPSLGANTDEWVASVVNYVRYEFGTATRRFRRPGDTVSVYVTPANVAAIRAQNAKRTTPWTLAELENNSPASNGTTIQTNPAGDSNASPLNASKGAPAKITGTGAGNRKIKLKK